MSTATAGKIIALALCVFCTLPVLHSQTLADTALVEMARAQVKMYDLPQVADWGKMDIVRSRYNTVYPVSWTISKASLTNGEALINFFVVRPAGKQKQQTIQAFNDKSLHRGIAAENGAQYLGSDYFRTADGKSVLRIDMYREKEAKKEYVYVYFVLLSSSTMVSSTAVVSCAVCTQSALKATSDKYRVLFDAMIKNIAPR